MQYLLRHHFYLTAKLCSTSSSISFNLHFLDLNSNDYPFLVILAMPVMYLLCNTVQTCQYTTHTQQSTLQLHKTSPISLDRKIHNSLHFCALPCEHHMLTHEWSQWITQACLILLYGPSILLQYVIRLQQTSFLSCFTNTVMQIIPTLCIC